MSQLSHDVTWWLPGPSCSCRAIQCHQQLWCLMASADMGTMPPPVSALCSQGCLAGQHGRPCRAVEHPVWSQCEICGVIHQ